MAASGLLAMQKEPDAMFYLSMTYSPISHGMSVQVRPFELALRRMSLRIMYVAGSFGDIRRHYSKRRLPVNAEEG